MTRPRFNLLAVLAIGAIASSAGADTLLQYTFEENPAGTVKSGSTGVQLLDSSGNEMHFTKCAKAGAVGWSDDVSPAQPSGSTSMHLNAAGELDTHVVDVSFASHPGLTIEFWYKPDLADTLRFLLDSGDGPNAWVINQEVPATQGAEAGRFNLEFGYTDNAETFRHINTATTFSTDPTENDWTHVAVVIDRTRGDIAIYFNGVEDAKTAGVDENIDTLTFEPMAQNLRLGSINPDGGFVSRAYIDDLRISSAALAPGKGTGTNELAWDSTLIVEPVPE